MDMKNMKDMFGQMRQAQKTVKEMQKRLASMRIEAETGGGTVKAVVDGEAMLVDLIVDPSILDADEIQVLPKLIKKAVVEAQKKSKKEVASNVKDMTLGGMNIPGMD